MYIIYIRDNMTYICVCGIIIYYIHGADWLLRREPRSEQRISAVVITIIRKREKTRDPHDEDFRSISLK